VYDGWGFEENVGYSTPEHRGAIERLGICDIHRRSFQSVAYRQLGLIGAAEDELDEAAADEAVPVEEPPIELAG
jgi:hypothetical protein